MTAGEKALVRLSRAELEAAGTDEARAELARRDARRGAKFDEAARRRDGAVDQALSDVLDLFESDRLPEAIALTTIRRLESDAPMASWSLMNQLVVLLSGTEDARGFRQWQAAGRTVKKGARAIYILGPKTIRREDPETGEKRVAIVGFVGIPVFAVEDTEGEPLERAPDYRPAELPPLFDVSERLGVKVRWTHFTRDYRGYWHPGRREIALMTHDERTWFHELGHAADQPRDPKSDRGGQDPAREIVAETVAATLCRLYGLDGYIYHGKQYVERYAAQTKAKDARRAAVRVLGRVQAALDLILQPEGAG